MNSFLVLEGIQINRKLKDWLTNRRKNTPFGEDQQRYKTNVQETKTNFVINFQRQRNAGLRENGVSFAQRHNEGFSNPNIFADNGSDNG